MAAGTVSRRAMAAPDSAGLPRRRSLGSASVSTGRPGMRGEATLIVVVFLATVAVLLLAWHAWSARPVVHGPGILAPDVPEQALLPQPQPVIRYHGALLHPLATYSLTARVLSRRTYTSDVEASISPLDLALGWGRMSDTRVLQHLDIGQGERYYWWRTRQFPIPRREIETHSANTHIVPADAEVAEVAAAVRVGDVVTMTGYLIEADRPGGWRWRSSLTRNDTGDGACELFYVEALTVAVDH